MCFPGRLSVVSLARSVPVESAFEGLVPSVVCGILAVVVVFNAKGVFISNVLVLVVFSVVVLGRR